MYFIVRESQTISSSPLIWCTLEEGHFFSEFGMEGLNAADNEIYLEFVAGSIISFGITCYHSFIFQTNVSCIRKFH